MNDINVNALNSAKNYASYSPEQGKKSKTIEINSTASTPANNVTLSDDAQEFLKDIPGKSVAKRARAALAQEGFEALSDIPFGKIVSTLARGLDLSTLLPEPVAEEQPEVMEEVKSSEEALSETGEEEQSEPVLDDEEIALSLLTPLNVETT